MMTTSKPGELATLRRKSFTRPTPAAEKAASFVLAVVDGPDAGLVVTIDANGPRVLLGQSPVCTARLSDPEVSRRHAALTVVGTHLQILDLGSTNGTTVNGVTIREAQLHGGEAIRVGSTVLSVRRDAPRFVELVKSGSFGRAVGESPAMKKLYPVLASLASGSGPVLLEGEAGTGKELVAEELHLSGARKEGPFVVLEASALPTEELSNRLFATDGVLEQAKGGVLFIDEIGNLPRDVQAKLVGIIDGGCDVRIVAGTRRDLDRDVAEGRFVEQLFFLFAAGRVELPPLRDREGDVSVLARHFWKSLDENTDLPEDFLPRFEHYTWPGNVRELRSAVVARMTLGELGATYRSDEAKERGLDLITAVLEDDLPFPTARERVVKEFERRYVERMLARHGGNVTRAARASGVAHRYFQLIRARLK
jgi:DNA-binding NtrC family response regulator